jgi:16S rRNA (adenine1518-N6/adenine1519-N6)-dimethyltransferase
MIHAKKSLGQNFLMHRRIAERIVLEAGLSKDSVVFEIGPGTGMLTRELLHHASRVIALEADAGLAAQLRETFQAEIADGRLELLHGDVRTFDVGTLPKGYAIVANIPYYITGEIIRIFLTEKNQPTSMTLLVQKEVAERVARSKKESLLSLSVKAYGIPRYAFTVPRGAFHPAPKVDSAVLHIAGISRKNFTSARHEAAFFEVLHLGFAHKRKKLATNLREGGFAELLIEENVRAEDVPLAQWLVFAQHAVQKKT